MKILQINAVNKIDSTGRNAYELRAYAISKGHSCIDAYSHGPSVDKNEEYHIGNKMDTKIHALLSRLSGKQGYFSHYATIRFLRFVDAYGPDVVLLHNLHGNYINLPRLLKFLANRDIPTVIVLHDSWFYTGKCCYYSYEGCYKWHDECHNCPAKKQYNVSWIFDRSRRLMLDKKVLFSRIPHLAVVGVSEWITNEARHSPVLKNANVFQPIYNWMDLNVFKPVDASKLKERLNIQEKKVLLAVTGRWGFRKGLDILEKISHKLQEDEVLVIVGNIDEKVSFGKNVSLLPATDSVEALVEYYSMSDVFIQPSREETFGKVTAEAICCGTPVVCFDVTANPELVGAGCGEVVPVEDVDAMMFCARKIAEEGRSSYIEICRTFANEHFSKDTNIEQYIKLFEKIINQKREDN